MTRETIKELMRDKVDGSLEGNYGDLITWIEEYIREREEKAFDKGYRIHFNYTNGLEKEYEKCKSFEDYTKSKEYE